MDPLVRDAHYAGAKKLGRGKGYVYPHDDPSGFEVDNLPEELLFNALEPLSLDEAYLDVTENKTGLATATNYNGALLVVWLIAAHLLEKLRTFA